MVCGPFGGIYPYPSQCAPKLPQVSLPLALQNHVVTRQPVHTVALKFVRVVTLSSQFVHNTTSGTSQLDGERTL